MTIRHRHSVHRLAPNIVGQVSSEFAAKFRLRAFRTALVRLLDDPQKVALPKTAVAMLREGRMVRNLAVEPQSAEPTVGQIEVDNRV
jgi:hypothetical protein